jgi:type I restriction enzyme R subunit
MIQDATDRLVVDEETKKEFVSMANIVKKLYKSILPDKRAKEFYEEALLIKILVQKIQSLQERADISELMNDIEKLLDDSIEADSYIISDPLETIDLSEVDFEKLRERFKTQKKHALTEQLKGKINAKLKRMARLNPTRTDFIEKFEQMIEEYNAGRINIEAFFEKLVAFSEELSAEDERHIKEELTEEELAVYDLMKKDGLTKAEEGEVKKVAKELINKLKREKLVLDWKKKQQTRAMVKIAIQDSLFDYLPQYSDKDCKRKAELIYRHVYDSYAESGMSVYS